MWATWGIVQQVVGPQVQATSVTTQIPTQITAGNLIVVHVVWSNTSAASVTDTLGNSYVRAGVAQRSANSNLISTQVFYAANAIGGYDRITATIGSSTFLNMYVYEISGAATSNPLDVANVANGTGFSIATGAVSTGAANDLVFAATGHHYASDLPGSGFTGLQAPKERYADAAGWIVESECGLRLGARGRSWSGLREPRRLARPTCSGWVGWPRCLVCRAAMTMPGGSSVDAGMEVTFRAHDGRTRMLIVQGGFPVAGVWDEFAGGWASILDGPGCAVAARVTDRS